MQKILTEDPKICDMEKIVGDKRTILRHVAKKSICALAGYEAPGLIGQECGGFQQGTLDFER